MGAMTKKKAGTGTAAKKSAKKKSSGKGKKDTNPAEVRNSVSKIVKEKAVRMAVAVIGEPEDGVPWDVQLATVKYLFEVASIYPPRADQESATAEEDCLAKTLLRRLNLPEEPIGREENDGMDAEISSEVTVAKAEKPNETAERPNEPEEKVSGSEPQGGEGDADSVNA